MIKRKGFIKIIEVILASFLLFFILSWILPLEDKREEYDIALLSTIGRDSLASLDRAGFLRSMISNNDINGLINEISKILPSNARFDIEILNLNKNLIKIGCNCSYEEKEKLKRMIGIYYPEDYSFYFRGRNIRFEILDNTNLNEMQSADIIVFFGCRNLSNYYNYLDDEKSFLMISNVACENNLFNISPKFGYADSFIINQNSLESFRIGEYFVDVIIKIYNNSIFWVGSRSYVLNIYLDNNSLPYVTYDNNENIRYYAGNIMIIDNTRIKIESVVVDFFTGRAYAEIRIIDRNYEFHFQPSLLVESNEKSLLVSQNVYAASQLNYYITKYGKGKVAWINDYSEERTDINQLTRAIILWLSENLKYEEQKPKNYVTVYYFVSGNLEFEPYMIKMNIWYIH